MRNSVSVEQIQDGLGRGGQDERCRLTRGADKPNGVQDLSPRPLWERVSVGRVRGLILTRSRNKSAMTVNRHPELVSGSHGPSKKAAFTLAEVLITLGIIGVVAAMTLPSLIQNYQKKALATQTQKFYSTMSQAVKQYMADYGVDDLRNTPLASDNYERSYSPEAIASLRDFATKYLKVVKECEYDENYDEDSDNCFAPEYRYLNNSLSDALFNGEPNTYVLADGSVIKIGYYGPIVLYVDVNGKKGPNRVGYDLWSMNIFYDGVIDESGVGPECRGRIDAEYNYDWFKCEQTSAHEKREERFEACKNGAYGGCFGHLLNNNFKFDY